jgi:hypothetical protein
MFFVPMILYITLESYFSWRCGTFKFNICSCLVGDFNELESYINEKESEQVKGTAAQIIHIQNIRACVKPLLKSHKMRCGWSNL